MSYSYFLRIVLILFIFASSSFQTTTGTDTILPTVIDLGYAKYEALFDVASGTTPFLGIRYAAPPTGTLRWKKPHAPSHISSVQHANVQPNRCMDANEGSSPTSPFRTSNMSLASKISRRDLPPVSEDCLFLNVYVPNYLTSKRDLPVVIWIHGGGYVSGGDSGPFGAGNYDGSDLIHEAGGGVIVVVIQHRLGLFGFLAGNEVNAGGNLNAGLLDQEFAMQWVQQHIGKFGGDPSKVTIWGESAGGGSVLQHIIANDGKTTPPLFRAAIISSLYLPSQYNFNDTIPQTLYSEVVVQANCSGAQDTFNCLQKVDGDVLQKINQDVNSHGFFGTFVFVPVVDGEFITQRPTKLLRKGKLNGDVLLSVTNTFEGAILVDPTTASTVEVPNFISQLFPRFGAREIAAASAQYEDLGTPFFQAIAIMGESIFICPTYLLLHAFKGKSYKGEFAVPPGHHIDDIFYYFPSRNPSGIPPYENPDFGKAFSESFLNFAMSLNPNMKWNQSDITPKWEVWEGGAEMLFNATEAGAPDIRMIKTSPSLLNRCNFWESLGALTGQ